MKIILCNLSSVADGRINLQNEYSNIQLPIFEGEHEMLTTYALNELVQD